jgi:hypothetical protein
VRLAELRALSTRLLTSKRRAIALVAAAVPAAVLLTAPPAAAAPSPVKVPLTDCPETPPITTPGTNGCLVFVIGSGSMKIGSITQPIDKPMRITLVQHSAPDGTRTNTMIKMRAPKLTVPGGVLGIPGSDFIDFLKLEVQAKYVDGIDLLFSPEGYPQVNLGLRFKIINSLMPPSCSIGSTSAPVRLQLAGTEAPVFYENGVAGMKVADTTFAAPQSSGCGILGFIADIRGGLPAPTGNSTTMQAYMGSKAYT